MSNIKYHFERTTILHTDYKKILSDRIAAVCRKIGFDDSGVTWIIFEPDKRQGRCVIYNIMNEFDGRNYGFCIPSRKEIWISTISILGARYALPGSRIYDIVKLPGMYKTDILTKVILDEITHIQTNRDHGSREYDAKLSENAARYYSSPMWRFLA